MKTTKINKVIKRFEKKGHVMFNVNDHMPPSHPIVKWLTTVIFTDPEIWINGHSNTVRLEEVASKGLEPGRYCIVDFK